MEISQLPIVYRLNLLKFNERNLNITRQEIWKIWKKFKIIRGDIFEEVKVNPKIIECLDLSGRICFYHENDDGKITRITKGDAKTFSELYNNL